ncbi:MAG TPA: histidinol-phosphate transaminase, partial [Feifaniaceae bacterium]|nr:histidinol-phosphate transaminase [Feifaniaceae bacterium]
VKAVAGYYGVTEREVLFGNGSDELLAFCFQAFCGADTPACYADITYGFYKVFARIYGVPSIIVPLDDAFNLDPADYRPAGGTVFIANPNAPTGMAIGLDAIESILKANPEHVVVIDEAYVDFGAKSAVPLVHSYENLVVVQTMSKSRSLAGARIGFAIANEALISDLNAMKFSFNPYNLNRLSLLAAEAAIADAAYFAACTKTIKEVRAYTAEELTRRGFTVLKSHANFVFAKPPRMGGEAYYQKLREKGVLVRHFSQDRIREYVRVTIGTQEQMRRLLQATDELWGENA